MNRSIPLFLVLSCCLFSMFGCGGGGGSSTQQQSSGVAVAVAPASVSLQVDTSQQFTPTVTGSTNVAVTWKVNGVAGGSSSTGTITAGGVFMAPSTVPNPSSVTVTAVSQADSTKSAKATVTIVPGGSGNVNQATQNPPIKLGATGGNSDDLSQGFCCSGTLGALVSRGGTNYVLSNNHVLARSDAAQIGDPIGHPGLVDNFCRPGMLVANLSQFVKLQGTKINSGPPPLYSSTADAAIAQVVSGEVDTTGSILQLGTVSGGLAQPAPPASTTATPTVGMGVAKSGRTSGLTCASISAVNLTVQVDYAPSCGSNATAFTVQYSNQIDIVDSTFSASGDSGSLIVDSQTAEPVGLLYGGGTNDTVANPISDVLNGLADPKTGAKPTIVGGATHAVEACTGATSQAISARSAATVAQINAAEMQRAALAKERHAQALMSNPAVFGVGVTAGDSPGMAAVILLVEQGKQAQAIPTQVDGVPTKVRVVPRFRAFMGDCARPQIPTEWNRPNSQKWEALPR